MKLSIKLLSAGCAACIAALAAPAFGQSLIGKYELVGRKCEGRNQPFIPIGDSEQTITLSAGGGFQGTYFQSAPDEMTKEEFREYIISRHLKWFEEDRDLHEEACREAKRDDTIVGEEGDDGELIDLCESAAKRKLYKRWRDKRLAEAEEEFESQFSPEEGGGGGPCQMASRGRWSASGDRLNIEETSLSATRSCGLEDGGGRRQMSGSFYFEDGDLYFVLPADRNSREYCGSRNWIAIFFRK